MTGYLAFTGLAMGLAASPHGVAMCGSPCAAMTCHGRSDALGFHLGRIVGYTAAGAVASASVTALGAWTRTSPALQPLWLLVHLSFLGLGLWCLALGRVSPNEASAWGYRIAGSQLVDPATARRMTGWSPTHRPSSCARDDKLALRMFRERRAPPGTWDALMPT